VNVSFASERQLYELAGLAATPIGPAVERAGVRAAADLKTARSPPAPLWRALQPGESQRLPTRNPRQRALESLPRCKSWSACSKGGRYAIRPPDSCAAGAAERVPGRLRSVSEFPDLRFRRGRVASRRGCIPRFDDNGIYFWIARRIRGLHKSHLPVLQLCNMLIIATNYPLARACEPCAD
jgi:hypothetical protein